MGPSAISARKVEHGNPLVVLGLRIKVSARAEALPATRARDRRCGSSQIDNVGFSARPSDDKRTKWCSRIRAALRSGQLSAGAAKKLTGALSWATSHMFRRIGRATLRPLLDHSHRRNPILREDARCSLTWWLDVVERGVAEHAAWEARAPAPPLLLWADARGSPARIAAVLYADGSWLYTDLAPDADVMRQFKARGDNQIAGLEMLAVALGVSTWGRLIQGRSLRVFSDNAVAEWGFRKGAARELDHAALLDRHRDHVATLCGDTPLIDITATSLTTMIRADASGGSTGAPRRWWGWPPTARARTSSRASSSWRAVERRDEV